MKVEDIATHRFRKQVQKRKIVLASQIEIEKFERHLVDGFLDRNLWYHRSSGDG